MKLFLVIAVALLAASASGTFFKKKPKFVDIHISKGTPPPGHQPGQPAPVGQAPPFVSFLPQGHLVGHGEGQFIPVQVGQVQKAPAGKVQGPLNIPVLSSHTVQLVPIHVDAPYFQPQLVSVEPSVQAIQLLFKTASSPLLVRQKHYGAPGTVYQATQSEDYPHVLRHVVHKPVVQEVREIVQPFRSITTQVQPVREFANTILPVQKQYGPSVVGSAPVHFPDQFRPEFVQGEYRFQRPEKGQPPRPQEPVQQQEQEQEQEPIDQHPVKGIV